MFVILLILLLPMRGWASEGMAIQMVGAASQSSVSSGLNPVSAAMPGDCPMMAKLADGQATEQAGSQAGCGCQSCHLCMPIAELRSCSLGAAPRAPSLAPTPHESRHVDADLAGDIKPPIS
ncbi:MAG: hypothetical protein LH632_07125 [Rhodoferax sp.]|nr:hypothetical protein [Rhodoferax sp.]